MRAKNAARISEAVAFTVFIVASVPAGLWGFDIIADDAAELISGQRILELPVRLVDAQGQPVAGAKVNPWALRSSQGHGLWQKYDERAGIQPQEVVTDDTGAAVIRYPEFRDANEQVRTIGVSLNVDHPDFAYAGGLHIDVPLETKGPYEIKLSAGVTLEIRPLIDGKPCDLESLYAVWSDGRSWQRGARPEKTTEGMLRIRAMPEGDNSVLLAQLEGERVSNFSAITEFTLAAGETKRLDVPLRPSLQIKGKLSDNVPRPVRNGCVKVQTLPPKLDHNRVEWFSWAPVEADGTFMIDGWPEGERLQLIGMCDGFVAQSGKAPDVVENPRPAEADPFNRPQVFDPSEGSPIEVLMTPMARCVASAVDEDGEPVAGVKVVSWPNVGWWNGGSQIYCRPLVRGERLLRERDYMLAIDKKLPEPFAVETAANGKATLELPVGKEGLSVVSDVYELPVFLGRRDIKVILTAGETTEATLRLQPQGTEKLGEWDKLAGVVFGCSTREGRRICALPEVQKKIDEFAKRFRDAKDQQDPQLLSEAYSAVAEAFENVGDSQEALKWREKAAEQAKKAQAIQESPPNDKTN